MLTLHETETAITYAIFEIASLVEKGV